MEYLPLRLKGSWGEGRTENYRGSVTSKDDRGLLALKESTQLNAKSCKEQAYNAIKRQAEWGHTEEALMECIQNLFSWRAPKRVTLMARGKRTDADGNVLHCNAYSNLRHEYASYWDVYVADCSSVYAFKEKLRAEFCPTMSRMEALQSEIRELEWKLKRDARAI